MTRERAPLSSCDYPHCDCGACDNRLEAEASHDGPPTIEMPALSFDDTTEAAPIFEYNPPKNPANDHRLTMVEMVAVSA